MSFKDALGYPFSSANIPKVLTIILIALIVLLSLVSITFIIPVLGFILLTAFIGLSSLLFAFGYPVEVMYRVSHQEMLLPEVDIKRDLGRGFVVLLAAFLHYIPFGLVLGVLAVAIPDIFDNQTGGSSLILIRYGLLVGGGIAAFFVMSAFMVGWIRFAIEDETKALTDFKYNFELVISNLGKLIGLIFRAYGISMCYTVLVYIVAVLCVATVSLLQVGEMGLYIIITLFGVVILSLYFMNQLSNAHLFAGFAKDIGITAKAKRKVKQKPDADIA